MGEASLHKRTHRKGVPRLRNCSKPSPKGEKGSVAMSPEDNKAADRRYVEEVLNRGNLEVIDELRTDDVEGIYQRVTAFRMAFPDLQVTIETQVAEGDWAVMRLTYRGTHLGPFMGVPPTGKKVAFATIAMNRYAEGKSVENWGITDVHGLLKQLQE
jgi:predicted ester cyclase